MIEGIVLTPDSYKMSMGKVRQPETRGIMTPEQTIAVIEFMNHHGAENVYCREQWQSTAYYCDNDRMYRLDVFNNNHVAWYRDNKSWRPDGKPATITNDGRKYYYNEDGSVNRYSR